MTRDRTIFNRCRPLADRHDILDLPRLSPSVVRRDGGSSTSSEDGESFFLKHAAGCTYRLGWIVSCDT